MSDELLAQLTQAHRQISERDSEIRRLVQRDGEIARLRAELEQARRDHEHVSVQLEAMRSTRAWRFVTYYWRLRERLLGG